MKLDQVKLLTPWQRYTYWITERERIKIKKDRGDPWPWTDDPILQTYRFCNVIRIEDRVSQWILQNWYEPNYRHRNMLKACALARFINLPNTLRAIGFPRQWDKDVIMRKLRAYRDAGNKVFNPAYVVRGNDGMDKIESVVKYYVAPLHSVKIDLSSMENAWKSLIPCYGFGSFMAGQVVADLRWANDYQWKDRKTWAPIGPGSKRGMLRLHPELTTLNQKEFLPMLRELITKCTPEIPKALSKRMEAIDWQNTLCEFDKFSRVVLGEGRPKSLYYFL